MESGGGWFRSRSGREVEVEEVEEGEVGRDEDGDLKEGEEESTGPVVEEDEEIGWRLLRKGPLGRGISGR